MTPCCAMLWAQPPVNMDPSLSFEWLQRLIIGLGYALPLILGISIGAVRLVNMGLAKIYGPGVTSDSMAMSQLREMENGYFLSVLMVNYIMAPLVDIGDTVLTSIC